MDRVRVKDIVDLMDYERTGETKIAIKDSEGLAIADTKSMLLDIIADFTVARIGTYGNTTLIELLDEDFDRFARQEAQE